jgi:hypothetical protein
MWAMGKSSWDRVCLFSALAGVSEKIKIRASYPNSFLVVPGENLHTVLEFLLAWYKLLPGAIGTWTEHPSFVW